MSSLESELRPTAGRVLKVLIVDDTPMERVLVKGALEREGHTVCAAATGEQGLNKALQWSPDLVLLDYMLPDLDGVDVVRRMRAHPYMRDIPIILLTASDLESTIEEAFAAGADDYLTKPVVRRLLLARVDAVIRAYEERVAARSTSIILNDLEEARQVQQSLLPHFPVQWDGWMVSGAVFCCSHVGGDMVDLMSGRESTRVATLVDVSGHGTAAALIAAQISSELRMLVRTRPLTEAFLALGDALTRHGSGRYVCMAAIAVHGNDVTIINAGLPPVCVLRGRGGHQLISASASPLGLVEDTEILPTSLTLEPGDRVVMLSDGLTEPFGSPDEVMPALTGLGLLDAASCALPSSALAQRIESLVGSTQMDDATLLVLERMATYG